MKICVIEDDMLLGRALVASLEDAGHKAIWVRMAEDARVQIQDPGFDAILLDLGLPDGDGIGLLTEARHQGVTTPILIITARSMLEQRLRGLDAGADDYLVKPFENAELLARLRAVLRRGGKWSADEAALTAGLLVMDEQRMIVSHADRLVSLSPTEFALLRELLRSKNRVRTRRQLEAQAMPERDSQSLDAHISNLRRKIGHQAIRTVRGVGYIIDDTADTEGRRND